MIYIDVTKTGAARHQSGLMRLSGRLRGELGPAVRPVSWDGRAQGWRAAAGRRPVAFAPADWLLTAELFSEPERPGFWNFLRQRPCRLAAVFCDAIPLHHPQVTWPQSVARHPEYLKMLAGFDRVWAISAASRDDLTGFWRWQQTEAHAEVEVLALGADSRPQPARDCAGRAAGPAAAAVRRHPRTAQEPDVPARRRARRCGARDWISNCIWSAG